MRIFFLVAGSYRELVTQHGDLIVFVGQVWIFWKRGRRCCSRDRKLAGCQSSLWKLAS